MCALLGAIAGYFITLIYRPGLIPPVLRIGGLTEPVTVLLMGTDVVYTRERRCLKADQSAFTGRSDTMLVVRLNPVANSISMLSIPRDTTVHIAGYGKQKINAANALGGPRLAVDTVNSFLNIPVDHFVVLNVHGLVELVDELGGITVEIPKRMRYTDRSAKLNIDLEAGPHTLNGTEAMGFVRFRHDTLGDIGRVQRQEIFLKAVQDRALDPSSWAKLPRLLSIAQNYVLTDMTTAQIAQLATFARAVPKDNQHMIMLPGRFSGTGDWAVDGEEVRLIVARLLGEHVPANSREEIRLSVENASSSRDLARRLSQYLVERGYNVVATRAKSEVYGAPLPRTRIIAQRGNSEEAQLVKSDLHNQGNVINASVGDIESAVTVQAGDDLAAWLPDAQSAAPRRHKRSRHR